MKERTPTLLDAKEVSSMCDCCPDDVIFARQKGAIRGLRHGKRHWRFTPHEAREFVIWWNRRRQEWGR